MVRGGVLDGVDAVEPVVHPAGRAEAEGDRAAVGIGDAGGADLVGAARARVVAVLHVEREPLTAPACSCCSLLSWPKVL